LSKLSADQITKLVVGLKGTHSVSGREYTGNVVKTITNANIFNNIASVKHIRTDGRHANRQGFTFGLGEEVDTHFLSTFSNLGLVNVNAQKSVDVAKLNFEINVLHRGSDLILLGLVLISDFYLLNCVLTTFSAVLTELSGENSEANLGLHKVSASDFNENVFSVEGDLGLLRVDDGR
jgi:hypothetical protein